MKEREKAFFVRRPRTIHELRLPHLTEEEQQFEIVRAVGLGVMDFENFVTDMLADRIFIEENAGFCSRGEVWKCVLVYCPRREGGVLVVPERGCFVGWAAYIPYHP